jgi:hypothetical protein
VSKGCIPLGLAGLLLAQLPVAAQQREALPAVPTQNFSNIGPPQSTILPTDILPLPTTQNRLTFAENLQLRMLQKLPSNFYFSATAESSFRYETNVYQFPKKQTLLHQLPAPQEINQLPFPQQIQLVQLVARADSEDVVYRILPNITGGFTLTPRTRVFANYFMISDTLTRNKRLDTVIHSYAGGIQQDIPLGSRANLQAEFQFRELNQMHQQAVFDFLPGLTLSGVVTPRLVVFVNALAQLRGKKYFQAPTKEIDPFYTWGALYQRGGWNFSASTTFVQNFREPFRSNATIPVNNSSFISDFEVSRRIVPQVPGLQAFVRAEPIWNIQKHNRPGLSGVDFRLYMGMRMAVAKPSLMVGMKQMQEQIREQEQEPPTPVPSPGGGTKPSASAPTTVPALELISMERQPIHGLIPMAETEDEPIISCSTPAKSQSPESSLPSDSPTDSLAHTPRPSL